MTEVGSLAEAFPRDTLFLDLETCGLAGSMLFLVGLIRFDGEDLVLEQLLARNYAEEQAVLHTLWQIAGASSLLVTFNGKSFDWPLLRTRHGRMWLAGEHTDELSGFMEGALRSGRRVASAILAG